MPVRVGSRPVAFKNLMTLPSNVESWSSSMKRCGPSPGNTSRSCCTTHAGVGSRVTLKCRIVRRWCWMTKKHESSWKVNVGTLPDNQSAKFWRTASRSKSGGQEPLPQNEVMELLLVKALAHLCLYLLSELEQPRVTVEVRGGLSRSAEGITLDLAI
jgi:hypothetical protein